MKNPLNSRALRTFAALVLCWIALPATEGRALAQAGRRALFGEAFRPDILQRDMTLMGQKLQLEEWQRPVIEQLVDDYATAFNTGVDALKDRMRAASESAVREGTQGGDQVLQRVLEPLKAWRTEKEQLLAKFTADVKSQLGEQQLERWPAFERALRRERLLPEGELSGERVDLFAVLERMQPSADEGQAVAAVLGEYELSLDRLLAERAQRGKEVLPRLEAAMSAMDYELMGDLQDQVMQASVRVRDANDAAIDAIAQAMGQRGRDFRSAALEAGYPEVYRIHPVMVLMQQVRALRSLTPEQVAQVEALMQEFSVACDEANAKLAATVKAEQPKAAKRRAKAMMDRKSGAAAGSPGAMAEEEVSRAMTAKQSMGEPFRERLMALLSPEQAREITGPTADEAELEKRRILAAEGKFKLSDSAGEAVDAQAKDQQGLTPAESVSPEKELPEADPKGRPQGRRAGDPAKTRPSGKEAAPR